MSRRSAGFTLIEMLVVIGIVAILAAILFPVLSRARESGRRANCLSNLQQISTAMKAYSTDYGGYIVNWCVSHPAVAPTAGWPAPPAVAVRNDPSPGVCTWDISIQRYLKNTDVLRCPSMDNPRTAVGRRGRAYAIARYTQRIITGGEWGPSLGRFEGDIPKPSDTVLLFEKGNNLPGSWGDAAGENVHESHNGPLDVEFDPSPQNTMTNRAGETVNVRPFHLNGKNILFVDGHAKFYQFGQGPFAHKGVVPGTSDEVSGMVWMEGHLPR